MCNGEGKIVVKESDILDLTADVWRRFNELPVYHPSDRRDVAFHIHAIQNIIATRAATRANPETLRMDNYGEITP